MPVSLGMVRGQGVDEGQELVQADDGLLGPEVFGRAELDQLLDCAAGALVAIMRQLEPDES